MSTTTLSRTCNKEESICYLQVVLEGVQVGRAVVQGELDASGGLVGRGEAADGDLEITSLFSG